MSDSIELRLKLLEDRVGLIERSGRPSARPRISKQHATPREFLLEKSPRSDNDKTLVAGYYIEMIEKKESFDFDDIEAFYHQAKEAAPKNRRDPPYQNVKKGFFREVGKRQAGMKARNRWALTNSGIFRVEKELVAAHDGAE
nr:hypothetical protein [Ferrimicrobium acidiphilum]